MPTHLKLLFHPRRIVSSLLSILILLTLLLFTFERVTEINAFSMKTLDDKIESMFLRLELYDLMSPKSTLSNNHIHSLKGRKYFILVDAGSSGSRVMVYSWQADSLGKSDGLPLIEHGSGESNQEWSFKEHPGISSFADKPEEVHKHIRPLMEFVSKLIPDSEHQFTPFYLFSTAGMRLVEKIKRQLILNYACNFVQKNYEFAIHSGCQNHFRVISGELEGIFGWLAVNYLKNKFENSFEGRRSDKLHTYGFMDMGGASMQIAFEPTREMAKKHSKDLMTLKLRSLRGETSQFQIYVTTFLGFGVNEARRRYLETILNATSASSQKEKEATAIDDACLPSELITPDEAHLPNFIQNKSMVFSGKGNFENCLELQKALLNKNKSCSKSICLLNDVTIPLVDYANHRFVGVSEYWYTLNAVFEQAEHYSPKSLLTRAKEYCSKNWNAIKSEYSKSVGENRLSSQCFKAAWIYNVLHEGFMIPVNHLNTSAHFQAADDINGVSISWTLGAMLLLVSSSIKESNAIERSLKYFSTSVIFFIILFGLAVFFSINRRALKAVLVFPVAAYYALRKSAYQSLPGSSSNGDHSSFNSDLRRLNREFSSVEEGLHESDTQVVTSGNYFVSGRYT